MRRVRLVADARLEFFKEIEYYERERQGLGRRFRRAAEAAFLRAGEHPFSGRPGTADTRRILIKGFPFAVVYQTSDTDVMVYAVAHLSRDPQYWIGRLPNVAGE